MGWSEWHEPQHSGAKIRDDVGVRTAHPNLCSEGQHGLYHRVTRCVRPAWLCGVDPLTRADYEQRKLMVEARIRELGSIFAVGIYAYAVMSNHLHVVVSVEPAAAADWKADKVAERWLNKRQ